MNIRKSVLFTTMVGLFSALAFGAQGEGWMQKDPYEKPAFEEIDKNADGTITKSEAQETWLAKTFAKVDVNQDGYVTKPEYEEARS
jgi:Ca2+-binding EF-hand superfamily protein